VEHPDNITWRCDPASEAFSLLTFPPRDIKACMQTWKSFAEMSQVQAYAVDSKGNLWRWSYELQFFPETPTLRELVHVVKAGANAGYRVSSYIEYPIDLFVVCCTLAGMIVAWLTSGPKQARKGT
jgi:hypothetical protein